MIAREVIGKKATNQGLRNIIQCNCLIVPETGLRTTQSNVSPNRKTACHEFTRVQFLPITVQVLSINVLWQVFTEGV